MISLSAGSRTRVTFLIKRPGSRFVTYVFFFLSVFAFVYYFSFNFSLTLAIGLCQIRRYWLSYLGCIKILYVFDMKQVKIGIFFYVITCIISLTKLINNVHREDFLTHHQRHGLERKRLRVQHVTFSHHHGYEFKSTGSSLLFL